MSVTQCADATAASTNARNSKLSCTTSVACASRRVPLPKTQSENGLLRRRRAPLSRLRDPHTVVLHRTESEPLLTDGFAHLRCSVPVSALPSVAACRRPLTRLPAAFTEPPRTRPYLHVPPAERAMSAETAAELVAQAAKQQSELPLRTCLCRCLTSLLAASRPPFGVCLFCCCSCAVVRP